MMFCFYLVRPHFMFWIILLLRIPFLFYQQETRRFSGSVKFMIPSKMVQPLAKKYGITTLKLC